MMGARQREHATWTVFEHNNNVRGPTTGRYGPGLASATAAVAGAAAGAAGAADGACCLELFPSQSKV